MVISLTPQLAAALTEHARRRGVAPESLAIDALQDRFLSKRPQIEPQDEWERGLLQAARDWGVSLSNSAASSDELYD